MQIRKLLASLFVLFVGVFTSAQAFAEEAGAEAAAGAEGAGMKYLAAALAIGLAAAAGAIGQAKAASTALDGIARNPNASGKIFMPMILALALIESLVIYALLIAFRLS